ncbi:phosphatase PAP2 family protein [Frankia sp. Cppng1_Ct_nod]|uniref:phosphatase PAP2 family protein n=1 Tax=Frankia sp. Cppng1_Ct_nod TaxID=2897162 RepID=UPI0013EFB5EB|nr:phosphatase PAP2 family protein [Frankia sp. Cppng1_Ct_nod]
MLFVMLIVAVKTRWSPLSLLDVDLTENLNHVAAAHRWVVDASGVLGVVFEPSAFRVVALIALLAMWGRASPVRGRPARGIGRLEPAGVRRLAVFVGITVGVGGLVNSAAKALVGRARPLVPHPVASAHGMSFPSGHSFGVLVAALVLLVALEAVQGRRPRITTMVLVGLVVAVVGFSRLALGVHYLSDVVGGYLLAVAWTAATLAAFSRHTNKRSF